MLELRSYQQSAIDAVHRDEARGLRRLLLHLPTGAGKTIIFSALTLARQKPTLILVHRKELAQQAYDKLKMVWPDAPVAIQRGAREPDTPIVVATVQTLISKLDRASFDRYDMIICDEAHHAVSPSWRQVLTAYGFWPQTPPGKLLVGVSATLVREDGLGLDNVFQTISYRITLQKLIDDGYLVNLRARRVRSQVKLDHVALRYGDYDERALGLAVDTPDRNALIARAYLKYAKGRPAIAFTVDVNHAKHLTEACNQYGIRAQWVAGSLSKTERALRLNQFHRGDYDLLINAQLLTEGYDEPKVSAVILARPTKSFAMFAQMVGRGLRLFPNKQDCLVIDVADVSKNHDLLDVGSLLGKKIGEPVDEDLADTPPLLPGDRAPRETPEALPITGEIHSDRVDLFTRSIFRWQREGTQYRITVNRRQRIILRPALQVPDHYEVIRIERATNGTMRSVDLSDSPLPVDWAMGVAEDWLRKHGGQAVRKDDPSRDGPPTEKQRALATEFGLTIEPHYTKDDVSHLLDQAMKERHLRDPNARWRGDPATPRSLELCALHHIVVGPHPTKGEVSDLIATHLTHCRCHRTVVPSS